MSKIDYDAEAKRLKVKFKQPKGPDGPWFYRGYNLDNGEYIQVYYNRGFKYMIVYYNEKGRYWNFSKKKDLIDYLVKKGAEYNDKGWG